MTFKMSAVAVATVSILAASGAQANFFLAQQTSQGNSTVAFVAIDNGANISLVVDLNTQLSSFLPGSSLTLNAGALSAPGTVAVWNFAASTFLLNGAPVAGAVNWASPVASFLANANVTGNGYQWGVIAADGVTAGNALPSSTNVVRGQNLLFTGVPDFEIFTQETQSGTSSGSVNNGAGQTTEYYANNNNTGTHTTTVKGASTSTGGPSFLGTSMAVSNIGDFGGGQFGMNNFLVDPGTTSLFTWASSIPAVTLYSLGGAVTGGSVSPSASTFFWDSTAQTLTYTVPVPEPTTYGMLLAGLAGLGFVARRRPAR